MIRKERIAELELIRALGFLAVVYQHVIGVYMRVPGIDEQTAIVYGMLFHLLKFAVPAFIFMTGLQAEMAIFRHAGFALSRFCWIRILSNTGTAMRFTTFTTS